MSADQVKAVLVAALVLGYLALIEVMSRVVERRWGLARAERTQPG